ncbi:hypothetical protein [Cyclonatronum proteinivorum]|uniref:hypothetical protein n=1 Tax=Cyclonatronum proteinivorum TaxID=1457365 RepID=UPI0013DEA8CE|nr:hypothetical protein [Cyclonatronum proteinivorum]
MGEGVYLVEVNEDKYQVKVRDGKVYKVVKKISKEFELKILIAMAFLIATLIASALLAG